MHFLIFEIHPRYAQMADLKFNIINHTMLSVADVIECRDVIECYFADVIECRVPNGKYRSRSFVSLMKFSVVMYSDLGLVLFSSNWDHF